MQNRRDFIKQSGTAILGSFLLSHNTDTFYKDQYAVGIQLFTFFNTIDADVQGTLKKIAALDWLT